MPGHGGHWARSWSIHRVWPLRLTLSTVLLPVCHKWLYSSQLHHMGVTVKTNYSFFLWCQCFHVLFRDCSLSNAMSTITAGFAFGQNSWLQMGINDWLKLWDQKRKLIMFDSYTGRSSYSVPHVFSKAEIGAQAPLIQNWFRVFLMRNTKSGWAASISHCYPISQQFPARRPIIFFFGYYRMP